MGVGEQRRWFGAVGGFVLVAGTSVWWSGHGVSAPAALAATAPDAPRARQSEALVARTAITAAAVRPLRQAMTPGPTEAPDQVADDVRVAAWVGDLRDDGVPGNAGTAEGPLIALPPGPVPALERALASFDLQQRHLAARILRRRCERGETASPRLFEVTVEALADRLEQELIHRRLGGDWNPSSECTRFLAPRAAAARDALRRALSAGDAQQRLLSAWLLAQSGDTEQVEPLCRELLPHLGDNDIAGDAVMAANGLYRLGPAALPMLRWWRQTLDPQARSLLDRVVMDLEQPPRSRADLVARGRLPRVTDVYHDPAIEYDVRRSWVPSWSP